MGAFQIHSRKTRITRAQAQNPQTIEPRLSPPPELLYADDLVLCGELEEGLRVTVGQYRRSGLKVNAGKSKVPVLNGEGGLECKVQVNGIHVEHVSEFKYLGCVLDKAGTDEVECNKKVASGRRVGGGIRSLVNTMDLQLEYTSLA